jgi:two-component system NtrC family sensor kinase
MQLEYNGIGLPSDNMERIFQYGFKTRQSGHGFDLHSGVLATRKLGGSLIVKSSGPDTGAVFTLELPLFSLESKHG